MGMREEFEAAMPKPEGVYWYEDYGRYMTTSKHLKCIDYNGKWEGWQASRAALVVTLPDAEGCSISGEYGEGRRIMLRECEEAFRAAGVTINTTTFSGSN